MMKSARPTKEQIAFRDDMIAMLRKHQHLRPDEMLAVAAYFVGQLVAMQDQRRMTPAMAMQIVGSNIEAGNQFVIADLEGAAPPRDIVQEGLGRRDITRKPTQQ